MNPGALLIITAHPEFAHAAVTELQQFDEQLQQREEFAPGIMLCSASDATRIMRRAMQKRPVFVRHLAPVQAIIELEQTEQDIGHIATAIAALPTFEFLERGVRFSVQTRLIQTEGGKGERPYSGGKLNQVLAEAFAEEPGAIESI